jgi:hypothetical protein
MAPATSLEADAPLGNWYIHRFNIKRRNIFIFMSESTYLSFVLYQGRKPVTATTLPEVMLAGMKQLLQMGGYTEVVIESVLMFYHSGLFTKTDSRSVLGVLNDLVLCYQTAIDADGGMDSCDLTSIIMEMNKMPQRTLQWSNSWEAVQAKLESPLLIRVKDTPISTPP